MGDDGTAEAAPRVAVQVPGYVVLERIGSGGFGEIYRARHAVIDREVAIKILYQTYATSPEAVARFVAEARAVNKISHPGIVEVYDFGQLDDGRHYYIMELVRGRTLRDVLRDRGALPLSEALPILRAIAEAVDAAHREGIAHRDLKPDNVFVLDGGGVKLIDFGLAKLTRENPELSSVTQTGAVFGTPLYMSPEQCHGKAVTTATDAYSFGALAYQVLVGEPPFAGDALGLALQHINEPPAPPSKRRAELSDRVDRVLLALLDKNPEARPTPLVSAIAAIAGEAPLPPARRRRRIAWITGGLVAAVAVSAAILLRTDDAPVIAGPSCPSSAQQLAGVWDETVRKTIEPRFAAATRPDLPRTWRAATEELEGYAGHWSTQWDAACQATDPLREQRIACLDNGLLGLRSAVALLGRADARDIADAWEGDLTDDLALHDCEAADALASQRAIVPVLNRDEVTQRMVGLLAFTTATGEKTNRLAKKRGRPALVESIDTLERTATRLETLGSIGANVAWTLRVHELVERAGDDRSAGGPRKLARDALDRAIALAEATRDDRALAVAQIALAELELDVARTVKADEAAARADAARIRAGGVAAQPRIETMRARIDSARGQLDSALDRLRTVAELERLAPPSFDRAPRIAILSRAGRHAEAVSEARALVAATARRFGEHHMATARANGTLVHALAQAGDPAGALATLTTLRTIYRELRAEPELVADTYWREAGHAIQAGRSDAALRAIASAFHGDPAAALVPDDWIRTFRAALDHGELEAARFALDHMPEPPPISNVWDPRNGRSAFDDVTAYLDFMAGDLEGMQRLASRVRPVFPSRLINNPSWFARVEMSPWLLGVADAAAGRRTAAEARLSTLAAFRMGSEPEVLSTARTADGWVLAALHRWPDARLSFEEARATSVWVRDWNLAEVDAWLGVARLEAGDPKAAIEPLEEALDVLASCCDGFHYFAPMAELALARALWDAGRDRARARRLAEQARDHFARLGRFKDAERGIAIRWLEEHPASGEMFAASVGYPTKEGPYAVRAGDLNGDGKPDLAIVRVGDAMVGVLINKGDGTFAPEVDYPTGRTPYGIALGDVDGDRKLDIVTADIGDDTLSVLINKGDGTFAPRVAYASPGPYGIAIGDLDGDGKPELIATNHKAYTDHTVHVLRNKGHGTFAAQVAYPTVVGPFSLTLGDVNGDGKLDVVVLGDPATSEVGVLLGRGDGTLSPQVTYPAAATANAAATDRAGWVAIGDLTGDGKPDLVLTNGTNSIGVLVNRGNGTFSPRISIATGRDPVALALADFDGDGTLDIVVDNYGDNTVGLLLNTGKGTFGSQIAYPIEPGSNALTCADLNGDGKPDVAVANYFRTDKVSVLLHK